MTPVPDQYASHHWSAPLADGSRAMMDNFSSGVRLLTVADEVVPFEFFEFFGPMPVDKHGAERTIRPRHPFWRAVSLWKLQGSRMYGNTAIWHEPRKPVLKHMGGRHWLVIKDGEPGHDW